MIGREKALFLALLALTGCSRFRKKPPPADAGAPAVAPVVQEPAPTATMLEAKDVPLGHWEATDGDASNRAFLSVLPDGLVRLGTMVPTYRNPARVFGQITHVEGDDADTIRVWVDVQKILAKEIGARHRRSEDFELFEAEFLGQRVTSPNLDGQHVPQLGGHGEKAAPPSYKLHFDKARETVEICTLLTPPKCRSLRKAKSPSDLSRVRTNGTCKVDDDCTVATDGEQCDPCLCPTQPSLKTWPHKVDPEKEDLSWETKAEHLCGKPIARKDTCAACPTLHASCKHQACVLKK